MGLGLKATIPLGSWSFWRALVGQQSRLKVSENSRNLRGVGGGPGVRVRPRIEQGGVLTVLGA